MTPSINPSIHPTTHQPVHPTTGGGISTDHKFSFTDLGPQVWGQAGVQVCEGNPHAHACMHVQPFAISEHVFFSITCTCIYVGAPPDKPTLPFTHPQTQGAQITKMYTYFTPVRPQTKISPFSHLIHIDHVYVDLSYDS